MYYAIVPISQGFSFHACETLEGLLPVMSSEAFVYQTQAQLSGFCDKQTLASLKKSYSVVTVAALHALVCANAKPIEEAMEAERKRLPTRHPKKLKVGKPIDGRQNTRRYMCLEVISKSADTVQALEAMMAKGLTRSRAMEFLRYALTEGYVIAGE